MNGGEIMVLLIVIVVMITSVLKARYKAAGQGGVDGGHSDTKAKVENQRLREEMRDMKERLAVLERLATDNNTSGARLDREIEKLRDRA